MNATVQAFGEDVLLPESDCPCLVINAKNGHIRENSSWVIGRLIRDYRNWCGQEVRKKVLQVLDAKLNQMKEDCRKRGDSNADIARLERPARAGLVIAIYTVKGVPRITPGYDRMYFSGVIIMVSQIAISAIPWGLYHDWSIFLITVCGTMLALFTGALPQWRKEKWACRQQGKPKSVILTQGQGSQYAVVIMTTKNGFDLEDLAGARTISYNRPVWLTKFCVGTLGVFWVLLLIAAAGIKTNTWFFLLVGGLGMVQNLYGAGAMRTPLEYGIDLSPGPIFGDPKVFKAILEAERVYPGLGRSMVEVFFPKGLTESEERELSLGVV